MNIIYLKKSFATLLKSLCLLNLLFVNLNCARQKFENHSDYSSAVPSEFDEESRMSGTDIVSSRKVNGLNHIWSGQFGFSFTNTEYNAIYFTRRAQLSPDGKIWFSVNGNPLAIMGAIQWEISAVKPFGKALQYNSETNTINGLQLDQVLGPKIIMGSAPTKNDNNGASESNYLLGSQLAISFNPMFATKGIPMEKDDDSCSIDKEPTFSPLDSAQFECLHLLVHQRGFDGDHCKLDYTNWNSDGGGVIPCLKIASLVVLLKKDHEQIPTIVKAHLGAFRLMGFKLADGTIKAMRQKTNEYAATSDSSLVFFVMLNEERPNQMPEESPIAYTFSTHPYQKYSVSPKWVSTDWTVPRSLWHLYEDFTENPKRKDTEVRGIVGGFRKAYPMAQYPFRFANGVRIREGLGRYQWFSPEGSDMLVNIGARSIAAILGRETRGIVKHLDSAAQVSRGQYCVHTAANEDKNPIPGAYCDPAKKDTGDVRCTENIHCTQQSVNGTNIVGIQEYTSPGSATGFWASPSSPSENAEPLFPLSRRFPLRQVLVNNKALLYFNPNNVLASRGSHQWVYTEVANDDFNDPNFIAFFHMNEGIFNARLGKLENRRQACTNGIMTTSCDIDVKRAFLDYNGQTEESLAVDTSANSYLGRLRPRTARGAEFPGDYWKSMGIGERIENNDLGTGEVNPGFLGRAVHFYKESYIDVPSEANSSTVATTSLANAKAQMTLELAVRLNPQISGSPPKATAKNSLHYTGNLVQQKNSWSLSLHNGRVRFSYRLPSNNDKGVFLSEALPLSSEEWTHLVVTFQHQKDDETKLKLVLYVNGAAIETYAENQDLPYAKLKAVGGAQALCIGPGCQDTNDQTEIWLDEVAISSIVRNKVYIAAAANRTYAVPGIDVPRAKVEFPKLIDKEDLAPFNRNALRIPEALLNLYANDKQKFNQFKNLGRALFHDPILSSVNTTKDNQRACSSCHAEKTNFTSPTHLAKDAALGGGHLQLNSPTILNRAFSIRQFLDERSNNVLDQVVGPITNPIEMGGDLNVVAKRINGDGASLKPILIDAKRFINFNNDEPLAIPKGQGITTYHQWFCYLFEGKTNCNLQLNTTHLKKLIATYELSLLSPKSQVDRMRAGETYKDEYVNNTIETHLKSGFQVFVGKGRCVGCHSGTNYTDELMHLTGPLDVLPSEDKVPRNVKTPTLRGLNKTFPYFHDGSNASLPRQNWCQYDDNATDKMNQAGAQLCRVVQFYNDGACRMTDKIKVRSYKNNEDAGRLDPLLVEDVACDPESVSLGLSVEEKRNLVEFLMHL